MNSQRRALENAHTEQKGCLPRKFQYIKYFKCEFFSHLQENKKTYSYLRKKVFVSQSNSLSQSWTSFTLQIHIFFKIKPSCKSDEMMVPSSGKNIVCNLDNINKGASYSNRLRLKHLYNLKSALLEKLYTCVSGWAGACKLLESISSITHSFYSDRVRHPCSENKAKFLGSFH